MEPLELTPGTAPIEVRELIINLEVILVPLPMVPVFRKIDSLIETSQHWLVLTHTQLSQCGTHIYQLIQLGYM